MKRATPDSPFRKNINRYHIKQENYDRNDRKR